MLSCSSPSHDKALPDSIKSHDSSRKDSLPDADYDDEGVIPPEFITDPSEKSILSINDTLYLDDTLKIRFKVPHPKDLAITGPDDKFFFLVYASYGSELPPLIDYNAFATMDILYIFPEKTKANPWLADVQEYKRIFTKPGLYRIQLSENLETDDGTPVEYEEVYYTGKLKGVR